MGGGVPCTVRSVNGDRIEFVGEKTITEAKSEIEAFATHAIHKAGLEAIKTDLKLNE